MKTLRIPALWMAFSLAGTALSAQTLDWEAVQKLKPATWISVETQRHTECSFQSADGDRLLCYVDPTDWLSAFSSTRNQKRRARLVFYRAEIRSVQPAQQDESKGPLALLMGIGGGGGWDASGNANGFAGVKLGGTFALDLQYDRIRGQNGFSTEGSAVLPLFRIPGKRLAAGGKFLRVYAEPGLGYRAGGGPFGGYSSAKVLVLLWKTGPDGSGPYIEFQRRFPFDSPLAGDNRIALGVTLFCTQCGFD